MFHNNTTGIDFVSKPPLDIAWNILSRIDENDLLEAAHVNKEWRKRVLNCSIAWQSIDITEDSHLIKLLPHVAQFIQRFTIEDECDEDLKQQCLELVSEGYFKSLEVFGKH